MTGLLPTLVFFLAFAMSSSGGQNAAAAASTASPTLQETTDWLKSHLVGVTHSSNKTMIAYHAKKGKEPREVEQLGSNTYESVSAVSFEGCHLTLGQLKRGDDYSVTTVTQIPIGLLTGVSWKTQTHDPVKTQNGLDSSLTTWTPTSEVVITVQASTKVMTFKRKSTGNIPLEEISIPFEGSEDSLLIRSDNTEMPPRLVKALNHAIDLCHIDAKPEPF